MQDHSMSPSYMWCHHGPMQDVEVQFALEEKKNLNILTFFFTLFFSLYCSTTVPKTQHFTMLHVLLPFRMDNKASCNLFFTLEYMIQIKRPFGRILSICETREWLCGSQRCHQSQHSRHVEWLNSETQCEDMCEDPAYHRSWCTLKELLGVHKAGSSVCQQV